jgi:hypothetical protein
VGPGRALSLPVALLVLAGTLASLGGAGVVAGALVAMCLDERDRRRAAKLAE